MDISNDLSIAMDSVCRVCLQSKTHENGPEFVSIFEPDGDNDHLFTKIMKCARVQITQDDGFPKEICTICFNNLNIAYKFKEQCEKSNEIFTIFLKTKSNYSTETSEDAVISDSKMLLLEHDLNIDLALIDGGVIADTIDIRNKTKQRRGRPKKHVKKTHSRKLPQLLEDQSNTITGRAKRFCGFSGSKKKSESLSEDEVKVKLEHDFVYESFEEDFIPEEIVPKVKKRRGRPKKIYWDSDGQILPSKPKLLYVCDKCGKSFKIMESLRGHQRRHTGEKPYMCSTCGKGFHVVNELKKHSNTHTGVKPYKCKYCDRKFNDWGSRFKHERCHRGERPYQCDLCPKTFSYSYVLNRHKLTHTGHKAFSCDLCKKNFTLKYHLTNHNRKYHNDLKVPDNKPETELRTEHNAKFEHHKTKIIIEQKDVKPVVYTIEQDDIQNVIDQNISDTVYNVIKPEKLECEEKFIEDVCSRSKIKERKKP